MAKVVKEVSCVIGTYEKDGQTKNRYQRIGSIIDTKNGDMLKLDVIPLKEGGWNGWAYLNDPQPKEDQPQRDKASKRSRDDDDDYP